MADAQCEVCAKPAFWWVLGLRRANSRLTDQDRARCDKHSLVVHRG